LDIYSNNDKHIVHLTSIYKCNSVGAVHCYCEDKIYVAVILLNSVYTPGGSCCFTVVTGLDISAASDIIRPTSCCTVYKPNLDFLPLHVLISV